MSDAVVELARRIVLRDGARITEGGYAAEYMIRELSNSGFFEGCDTSFEYSVWSARMPVRNSDVPKNQYLVLTSPSTPYSDVSSPVFSSFQKNGMCLYEYKYHADIAGQCFRFLRRDGVDLEDRLVERFGDNRGEVEKPWTDTASEKARTDATDSLLALLGKDGFIAYAANRYLANNLLTPYSKGFIDLDRVGVVNNRLVGVEMKRKYPARNDTFGLDTGLLEHHGTFRSTLNGSSVYLVTNILGYGYKEFKERKPVIPYLGGQKRVHYLQLDKAIPFGQLTTPSDRASSLGSHEGQDRKQLSYKVGDFQILDNSSRLRDLLV